MLHSDSNTQFDDSRKPSGELMLDDCWNRIGIQGDRSCPELLKHAHCRNCPVFVRAGLKLLDRELTQDYKKQWTELLAQQRQQAITRRYSALVFRIERNWLALRTGLFQGVVESKKIHSLPHRRGGIVLGLTNIRGELAICISLDRLLALKTEGTHRSRSSAHDRFLVVNWKESRFVFPVEEISGIHRFNLEELRDAPESPGGNLFVRGVLSLSGGLWVHCLDETRLMDKLNESLT